MEFFEFEDSFIGKTLQTAVDKGAVKQVDPIKIKYGTDKNGNKFGKISGKVNGIVRTTHYQDGNKDFSSSSSPSSVAEVDSLMSHISVFCGGS